jgi:hypothetical protein
MSKKSPTLLQNSTDAEVETDLKKLLVQQEQLAAKIDHLVFNWLYLDHDLRGAEVSRESGAIHYRLN